MPEHTKEQKVIFAAAIAKQQVSILNCFYYADRTLRRALN